MKHSAKSIWIKSIILILVLSSLAMAYILGYLKREKEILQVLEKNIPAGTELDKISENPLILESDCPSDPDYSGYVVITKTKGWGGPLTATTFIDSHQTIQQIIILEHKETPSFFYKLEKKKFFDQFLGKKVSDPLLPGVDIDTISQATVSSRAFTQAVRNGSHMVGRKTFRLSIPEEKTEWEFGINEFFMLLILAAAVFSLWLKRKLFRYILMAVSFVFLGFYLNSSLSIAHFSSLLLGYFPSFRIYSLWWILLTGTLVLTFLLKKNVYCYGLCPFGNLQEMNAKVSGINLPLHPKIIKLTKYLHYTLTWFALAVIFLTANPALGAYEPFPTLFGLQGMEIQWFILAVIILGSFVLNRFFCRFFCPVGVILIFIIKARRRVDKLFKVGAQ